MTQHRKPITRRQLLRGASISAAATLLAGSALAECLDAVTPGQPEGPFYPLDFQWAQESDQVLTRVVGSTMKAEGTVILIAGTVTNTACEPVEGVQVEIWQATARGRYNHPIDQPAPLWDPTFQGWGRATTDVDGHYWFKTVIPGQYAAGIVGGQLWVRPSHLHIKALEAGNEVLTSQMYFDHPLTDLTLTPDIFDNQELNNLDYLLGSIPSAEQDRVLVGLEDVPLEMEDLLEDGEEAFLCPFGIQLNTP